jgi:GTP 3',8-cyclase
MARSVAWQPDGDGNVRATITRKPKGHDFDYSRQEVRGQMTRHMSHTGG